MDELERWLAPLGLAQLVPVLRANDVDLEILPELSEADMEKLGFSLGQRKKLLKAAADLPHPWSPTPSAAPTANPSADSSAERRQLTVMFCDLVGSTALASRLDPEDLREIIGAYHKRVAKVVGRYDGFIAKYMGDGVLVYFGYPQAHEDDGERAVRAGLKLTETIHRARPRAVVEPLQVRVGIATGLVVVGDLVGSGEAQERGVVGETPNLAARLQALAEPNAVVIAASTHRLVGGLFEYEDLGAVEVKGYIEPVRAWQVRGRSATASRYEALHPASALTPLVGREEEVELLLRRWQRAKSGDGQVVLFSGQPGIGKSRLIAALQERIGREPHTCLRYFCSPYHQDSALHPILEQLERAAGFERQDAPEIKLEKLETLLSQGSPLDEEVALIADLLSLKLADRYPPFDLTPQGKKEKTFETLLRQVEGLARQTPVLMVFEDAQWIDPTSCELLDLVVERVQRLPVLLLITFRPEFQAPWTDQAHVTMLALNRLDRRGGVAMVERIIGNTGSLPGDIVEEIVERSDGVPLFVEELTKAVLEASMREADVKHALSTPPSAALLIPATLHASLIARLDRLGPGPKEIAQIGAAIGRGFSYELVASVANRSGTELKAELDQLTRAGLVFQRGTPPDASYSFKHALVQDAAYSTLLRVRRQELHHSIADVLAQRFPEITEARPEVLARHYTQAGLTAPAIDYWQRAGERATNHSANREAIAHLRKALELTAGLPDQAAQAERELRLLIALGPALMTTTSWVAPEVMSVYARARQLAQKTGRSAELFATVWGSWLSAFAAGDLTVAEALIDELFQLAQDENSTEFLLQANHAAWPTTMVRGDLQLTRRLIEEGLSLYRRDVHSHHAFLYGGHDPAVCGHATAARVLCFLGYPDQGLAQDGQAMALARDLSHPPTLVHAYWHAAELHQMLGDAPAAKALAEAMLPLLAEHGSPVNFAMATMVRGWALTVLGQLEEGLDQLRSGLAVWRGTGLNVYAPYRLARAADALLLGGAVDDALPVLDEAFAIMHRHGVRWIEAELHRVKGTALLLRPGSATGGDQAEAEERFRKAIAVARGQDARLLELRAANSLARLWRDWGKHTDARDLLEPVYGWFTEGFDTPDLQEARALLDALR